MTQTLDPVGSGFVASLGRPGGNITGLSTNAPEIAGKRLELLKQVILHLARLAILDNATAPGNAEALRETELAARASGVQLDYRDVRRPEEIDDAFRGAAETGADALLALGSPLFILERRRMVNLAMQYRLPASYHGAEHVRDGG